MPTCCSRATSAPRAQCWPDVNREPELLNTLIRRRRRAGLLQPRNLRSARTVSA